MINKKIPTAAEVVSTFLIEQAKDEDLDPDTVRTVAKLRDEGKLTKTNLLRQLEALREATTDDPATEGSDND
ncbi:hypothetical protein CCR90_13560 [Rhodovulum sulfidophilum]|uniref:hypothetical protein n=1 Tax=Rhodovulum sulfidophilum TaxID=35806 RepID=UPI00191256C1|nr:hypothetical protein [Rhodovulum sulfidophilum]MBK5924776.1 hypothetical protein [Rhodovulum sulfidophilum]